MTKLEVGKWYCENITPSNMIFKVLDLEEDREVEVMHGMDRLDTYTLMSIQWMSWEPFNCVEIKYSKQWGHKYNPYSNGKVNYIYWDQAQWRINLKDLIPVTPEKFGEVVKTIFEEDIHNGVEVEDYR